MGCGAKQAETLVVAIDGGSMNSVEALSGVKQVKLYRVNPNF